MDQLNRDHQPKLTEQEAEQDIKPEVQLTEQEAELYDRQIRLWGLDSQKRLRSASILLCGINGLGAEIAKNIILAGVKSVTLLDHKLVSETDACSQFLVPNTSIGLNRAEASLVRAQALNLMVELIADTGKLADKADDYFADFDVVFVTEITTEEIVRINNTCRSNNTKFFAGDVWGMFGYGFTDLQEHSFAEDVVKHKLTSKPFEKPTSELVTATVKRTLIFPPFQDILDFDYKSPLFLQKIKRCGPSYLILRILYAFRDRKDRDPSYINRKKDMKELLKIRDEIAPDLVLDSAFIHVFAQISAAVAVVGGEISQEIIKAVSQKEAPHHNIFMFDPESCCGFIESIACKD